MRRAVTCVTMMMMAASCSPLKHLQVAAPEPVDLLQGRWKANCVKGQMATLALPATFGITQRSEISVSGETLTEVARITSESCEGNDIEITATGTFTRKPAPQPDRPAAMELSFKIDSVKVRPVTEFGERILNLGKRCGVLLWERGIDYDVTGAADENCFRVREVGTVYSLEQDPVVEEKLSVGSRLTPSSGAATGDSPGERPKQLNNHLIYTRL